MKILLLIVFLSFCTSSTLANDSRPDTSVMEEAAKEVALSAWNYRQSCERWDGKVWNGRCVWKYASVSPIDVIQAKIAFDDNYSRYMRECPKEFTPYDCVSALKRAFSGLGL